MSFNCKYLKWFLVLLLWIILRPSFLIADNNLNINILNSSEANKR